MITEKNIVSKNNQSLELTSIKWIDYNVFYNEVISLMENENIHCISYFAYPHNRQLYFICLLANDETNEIYYFGHKQNETVKSLASITEKVYGFHIFEREIHENYGIEFENHPWLKPVRFAHNRAIKLKVNDYPFYKIKSNQLHEVGVGPIHAGVIEPGHFRFTCNGENVLHLEIQLGWQHRGVEQLLINNKTALQKLVLSENIAGDTAVGHSLAFANAYEALWKEKEEDKNLDIERIIALELERIAIHTGDLSAMCTDVAYQLGNAVFGALRTPIINFTQSWCGNRFGKNLIRIGGTYHILTNELKEKLTNILNDFEWRFKEIADHTFNLPSVIRRFENIGTVTTKQVKLLGAVGMVAKMGGLKRDVRWSHPFNAFKELKVEPIITGTGDVFARALQRKEEVLQSIHIIRSLLEQHNNENRISIKPQNQTFELKPNCISVGLTEGWRGEIAHVLITDEKGEIIFHKVKDPSMHNWKSLELSLRNLEISDFPINNKSYDLSYCGHDL